MFIDKKGKLFGKISIVDILIIIVVIVFAVGFMFKVRSVKTVTPFTSTDKIQIEVINNDMQGSQLDYIKVGDEIIDNVQNVSLGKVTKIEKSKSLVYTNDSEGNIVESTRNGYYSVKFTAIGSGLDTGKGVTFGSSQYFVGKFFAVRIGNVLTSVRIDKMDKLEAQ